MEKGQTMSTWHFFRCQQTVFCLAGFILCSSCCRPGCLLFSIKNPPWTARKRNFSLSQPVFQLNCDCRNWDEFTELWTNIWLRLEALKFLWGHLFRIKNYGNLLREEKRPSGWKERKVEWKAEGNSFWHYSKMSREFPWNFVSYQLNFCKALSTTSVQSHLLTPTTRFLLKSFSQEVSL